MQCKYRRLNQNSESKEKVNIGLMKGACLAAANRHIVYRDHIFMMGSAGCNAHVLVHFEPGLKRCYYLGFGL